MKEDKYGVAEIQKKIFEILLDIDGFCRENRIFYSISGGTLLGAVRHKGFIPWDDDADLMFDRKNYKLFLDNFEQAFPKKYKIVDSEWVKRVFKIKNGEIESEDFCVDLFVFDEVPNNKTLDKIKIMAIKFIQGTIKAKTDYTQYPLKYRLPLMLTNLVGRPFSLEQKLKIYDKVSLWTGEKNHKNRKIKVYNTTFYQVQNTEYKAEDLDSYVDLDFCGAKLMSMTGYIDYLEVLYGDYMQLPDEEKRVPKHKNIKIMGR